MFRVEHNQPDDSRSNPLNSLCETPDLILTSSPKITSPSYKKTVQEHFLIEERQNSFLGTADAKNR